MKDEPDAKDPSQMFAHRVITALRAEFGEDRQTPRFVVVVEMPPHGRIAIASTGDDTPDAHRILALGAASVRAGMTEEERQDARRQWVLFGAGLERMN